MLERRYHADRSQVDKWRDNGTRDPTSHTSTEEVFSVDPLRRFTRRESFGLEWSRVCESRSRVVAVSWAGVSEARVIREAAVGGLGPGAEERPYIESRCQATLMKAVKNNLCYSELRSWLLSAVRSCKDARTVASWQRHKHGSREHCWDLLPAND
jgi:hypothetical protein